MASVAADRLASELFFSRRELRLRARIDGLLVQRAAKERRILQLERQLRWAIGINEEAA